MKTKFLLFTILFFAFGNLIAQEKPSQREEELKNEYFGNSDFQKAIELLDEGKVHQARMLLHEAIEQFDKEENVNGHRIALSHLSSTYQIDSNTNNETLSGRAAFENIKRIASRAPREYALLIYNIGLAYLYPSYDSAALKKFFHSEKIVKNLPLPDTLLLGKIYNSIGQVYLQSENFDSAHLFFSKSETYFENHLYFKECKFGTMEASYEPRFDTTIYENGDTVIYGVGGSLEFYVFPTCQDYLNALSNTYNSLGEWYRINGDYEKSLEYLDKGIEKLLQGSMSSLNFIEQYYQMGLYYLEINENENSNFYFKNVVNLIKLYANKDELKNKKEYYLNKLLPFASYFVGANYLSLEQRDAAVPFLEKTLEIINDNSEMIDLQLKTYTALGEISYSNNIYTENNFHTRDLFNYIDSVILKNQPLSEIKEINITTKANYNLIKAKVLMWFYYGKDAEPYTPQYFYKTVEGIELFKENLKFLPPDQHLALRAKINLELANNYYIYAGRDSTISTDSSLYYVHQALINVCKKFDSLNQFHLPALEDLKEIPIVQEVLLEKIFFMIKDIGIPVFPDDREEMLDFFRLNTFTEDSPYFEEFTQMKNTFEYLISLVDLADQFHDKQIQKASFAKSNSQKEIVNRSIDIYHHGIYLSYFYNAFFSTNAMNEKAFYFTQKMKGQKLLLSIIQNEAFNNQEINQELLEKEQELIAKIAKIETYLFEKSSRSDINNNSNYELEFINLLNFKRQLDQLHKKIENQYPEYSESKYKIVHETVESVQELLQEDEVLIEYVMTCCEFFIIVISKDSLPVIVDSSADSNASYYIYQLKTILENSTMARKSTREKFVEMSHKAYKIFVKPIENIIADKKRLILIADNSAHYLPFEILLKSAEVKPYRQLDYLINTHEISYHYSSTLFAKARRKKIIGNPGIYAFAPVYNDGSQPIFDDKNISLALEKNLSHEKSDFTFRALDADGNFIPLPESEKEVKAIFKLFNKKTNIANNTQALREEANEKALKNNLEKPYRYIHIAGHSFANIESPNFSGIACYETNEQYPEDGTLYAHEIYNMRTQSDLVTLSSCESGNGKLDESDGILGLNRAFIEAGTTNVVFSLWKVYDKVNATLMVDFYSNILSGKNYAASLREAKLKLLKNEATASPHFWSPYLLIGR